MLTFRQGHEKGERQSDQVAGSESFCSPEILCVYSSVLLRANVTARERMGHFARLFTCWVCVSGCHCCSLPPPPGFLPRNGSVGKGVWMLVKQTNITQSCLLTPVSQLMRSWKLEDNKLPFTFQTFKIRKSSFLASNAQTATNFYCWKIQPLTFKLHKTVGNCFRIFSEGSQHAYFQYNVVNHFTLKL